MTIPSEDIRALVRDKYDGSPAADIGADVARLMQGEPLAYVIGWQPFLGLRIYLDSRPLIPRPETEWWTEQLIAHLKERFAEKPFTLLDLCAGSGAIGLAVLHALPNARVAFGELTEEHADLIRKNLQANGIDPSRADIRTGDLFAPFGDTRFDVIATNPPYIPSDRQLPESVTEYEPKEALFAGTDGLDLMRRIAAEAPARLNPSGELWVECDIANIEEAERLLLNGGATSAKMWTDPYGRPRLVVSYYP